MFLFTINLIVTVFLHSLPLSSALDASLCDGHYGEEVLHNLLICWFCEGLSLFKTLLFPLWLRFLCFPQLLRNRNGCQEHGHQNEEKHGRSFPSKYCYKSKFNLQRKISIFEA